MSKENYQAWEIDIQNFPQNEPVEKQIEFLLGFAVLAPSAHNSQPWELEIKADVAKVFVNHDRDLSVGDNQHRLLYLAFGCFLENLKIAGDYFGFDLNIQISENPVFTITFTKNRATSEDSKHLIFQIVQRRNNRYKYKDAKLTQEIISKFLALSSESIGVQIFNDPKQKNELAVIMGQGQVEAMESSDFRLELSKYFKSSFTNDKFGMPGFALNVPGPVSVFASALVKKINMSKLNKRQDLNILQEFTPAIGVITTKEENYASWIDAGRVLERLWLMATEEGLTCSIWAAAVEDSILRSQVIEKTRSNLKPVTMFRIGYPVVKVRPSPRFLVKDLIKHAT